MTDELFDIVDAEDQVIGQAPRSDVHARGLLHRAIHVFVFRADGRLLIHLRTPTKEEFPNVWTSSASGHVSAGETYDEAAPRELREELGLTAPLQRMNWFAACPDTSMEHTVLYRTMYEGPLRTDPSEIAAVEWVTIAEVHGRIASEPETFSPAFRLLFNWYVREQGAQTGANT